MPASTSQHLDRSPGRVLRDAVAGGLFAACTLWLIAGWQAASAQAVAPDTVQLSVQRSDEALYLTARLELAPEAPVESALFKAVPLYFVWQVDVYRQRWYWADKRVASANRTLRLAYQPLTRRWRMSLSSEAGGNSTGAGLQYTLHQNFESLTDALAGVGRVSRWKVADAARLEEGGSHRIEVRFRLDLSLLPRPFQIGMANQPEWTIDVERSLVVPERTETEKRPDSRGEALPVAEPPPSAPTEPAR